MPPSNFQPIRLLNSDCWYKFTYWMTNSADPDQLPSEEANWSGSTLFAKVRPIRVQQHRVKVRSKVYSRKKPKFFFFQFFKENKKSWYFMWIICKSIHMKHQNLFSLKKKTMKILPAAVWLQPYGWTPYYICAKIWTSPLLPVNVSKYWWVCAKQCRPW